MQTNGPLGVRIFLGKYAPPDFRSFRLITTFKITYNFFLVFLTKKNFMLLKLVLLTGIRRPITWWIVLSICLFEASDFYALNFKKSCCKKTIRFLSAYQTLHLPGSDSLLPA